MFSRIAVLKSTYCTAFSVLTLVLVALDSYSVRRVENLVPPCTCIQDFVLVYVLMSTKRQHRMIIFVIFINLSNSIEHVIGYSLLCADQHSLSQQTKLDCYKN